MPGQVIKAFVVCRVGITASSEELITYCSEKLPRYMLPMFVEVLSELPKPTSGKVADPVYVGVKSYEPPPLHESGL
jgi:acyl-coenzyme A synthetase/AMP-(fatty) acid ligase